MNAEQVTLEAYATDQTQRAQQAGEDRSRWADRPGFDEALDLIYEMARTGEEFTADHVRNMQQVGTPAVLGSAFGHARKLGWITVAGVTTARSVTRHGALQRVWVGAL